MKRHFEGLDKCNSQCIQRDREVFSMVLRLRLNGRVRFDVEKDGDDVKSRPSFR